ncbi:MAG: hypothetical protein K0Q73_5052 [Paenibacillus sp.]|nr:hypothetical protein [Paenibacillus sp.]
MEDSGGGRISEANLTNSNPKLTNWSIQVQRQESAYNETLLNHC